MSTFLLLIGLFVLMGAYAFLVGAFPREKLCERDEE